MQAITAYNECMKRIQYTIRGVPEQLDGLARRRARKEGRSMNQILLDALGDGLGVSSVPRRYSDLDDLAGSWVHDSEFDRAIEEMDRIDPELWK
jgi:hypothetical protein